MLICNIVHCARNLCIETFTGVFVYWKRTSLWIQIEEQTAKSFTYSVLLRPRFCDILAKKSKCRIQICRIFVLLTPLKQCINLKWPLNILNHVSHSHLFMSSHIEHYYIPNCKRPITSHHSYHLTVQYPTVCVQLTSHVRSTIKAVDRKKHPNEVLVHFVWAFEQNTSP